MMIAICLLHSDLRPWEHTDLKVHFSHSRQAKSVGPRHTPGCARGRRGTWHRPARSPLGLRWPPLLWRPAGGPCRPDRTLRRKDFFQSKEETDVISEEIKNFRLDLADTSSDESRYRYRSYQTEFICISF